jgi:hypothetical protein
VILSYNPCNFAQKYLKSEHALIAHCKLKIACVDLGENRGHLNARKRKTFLKCLKQSPIKEFRRTTHFFITTQPSTKTPEKITLFASK